MRLLVVLLVVACASSPQPKPKPPPQAEAQAQPQPDAASFEATVRVQDDGVFVERDDGELRWISREPEPWWTAFDGRRVIVQGHRVGDDQLSVTAMKLADSKEYTDDFVAVGPEIEIDGRFKTFEFPRGTKLAGEQWTVFRGRGVQYFVSHYPDPMPELGERVRVRARTVEPSPYIARPGGPYLWVIEVIR